MGTHKVFEGSADANFSVNEEGKSITAQTGNVSFTLDGVTGSFGAQAGIMAMIMDGLGNNICLQNTDGTLRVCVNVATNVITIQFDDLRILINSPPSGISILIGDIGITIVGGGVSIVVDAGCLDIGGLIEILLKLVKILDYIPGLPGELKFAKEDFLCEI